MSSQMSSHTTVVEVSSQMSSQMSSPAPVTPQTTDAWLRRIATVQREKATPEAIQELERRQERSRRVSMHQRKSVRMQQSISLSSAAFHSGVAQVESASSTPIYRGIANAATVGAIGQRAVSAMAALSSPDFLQVRSPALAGLPDELTLAQEEAEEEALAVTLARTAEHSVAAGTLDVAHMHAALEGNANESALDTALQQLESEPQDEQACAAKFELYEGYSKLTSDARQSTHDLWQSVQGDFAAAPAVKDQIDREIKNIDKETNLGIQENPRFWFVHGMCSATARNQKLISSVLSGITSKLELLSSQTECPICFEAFGTERSAATLGCAHKTCQECWAHWCSMNGMHTAPCPLCRHDQFLDRVLNAVQPTDN